MGKITIYKNVQARQIMKEKNKSTKSKKSKRKRK